MLQNAPKRLTRIFFASTVDWPVSQGDQMIRSLGNITTNKENLESSPKEERAVEERDINHVGAKWGFLFSAQFPST